MTLNVALIGGGIFAREAHLPAIKASKELNLVAIYSRSLQSAKGLAAHADDSAVGLYSDDSEEGKKWKDLLAREDVHAVIIALPILVQPKLIRETLLAGKHVFSEKPIAPTVKEAEELISWYRKEIDTKKVNWAVAENYRVLPVYQYAADQARGLGRLLGFQAKEMKFTKPESQYYQTSWRKNPGYQGGFLLDGGPHYVAVVRQILGQENAVVRASAFTSQLRDYLPPIDTFDAVLKTKSGVSGTFSVSFGTTFPFESRYAFAFENGSVIVAETDVTVIKDGKSETKHFEKSKGVVEEVALWGEQLKNGTADPRQTPEEGLEDLKILEAIFNSGDNAAKPYDI